MINDIDELCAHFKTKQAAFGFSEKAISKKTGISLRDLQIIKRPDRLFRQLAIRGSDVTWARRICSLCLELKIDCDAALKVCHLEEKKNKALAIIKNSVTSTTSIQHSEIDSLHLNVAYYSAGVLAGNLNKAQTNFYELFFDRVMKNIDRRYKIQYIPFDNYKTFIQVLIKGDFNIGIGPFKMGSRQITGLDFLPLPLFKIRLSFITANDELEYTDLMNTMVLSSENGTVMPCNFLTFPYEAGNAFLRSTCGLDSTIIHCCIDDKNVAQEFVALYDKGPAVLVCNEYLAFHLLPRIRAAFRENYNIRIRDLLDPRNLDRIKPILPAPTYLPSLVAPLEREEGDAKTLRRPWLKVFRESMNELFSMVPLAYGVYLCEYAR